MEGDAAYFARRAHQEQDAGVKAKHPDVRQAHLEIAARYLDLAREIRLQERLLLAEDHKRRLPAEGRQRAVARGVWL